MASLLWGILPKKYKNLVSSYLTNQEKEILEKGLQEFLQLPLQEQKKFQKQMYYFFSTSNQFFLVSLIISFLGFIVLFITYIVFSPKATPTFLFTLFWPLALGVFSFYLVLTLEGYEFHFLFRIPKKPYPYFFSIFVFYFVFFILFLLNQKPSSYTKLNGLEKAIFGLGVGFAPLSEEIVFRHLIPKMLCNRDTLFCMITSHFVSNLGFAFLHFPKDVYEWILYFLSGMFLSLLRIELRSLVFSFLVHSFANLGIFFLFNF